jgi:isoleucyl-tRNA synthetase
VWETLSGGEPCVFEQTWCEFRLPRDADALRTRWGRLRALRSDVLKELEELRVAGKIGSSLAGEVDIYANGAEREFLKSFDDDLRFVFITSRADVGGAAPEGAKATALRDVSIAVTPSPHRKCERCWHYRPDVGGNSEHPGLCGRCMSNLFGAGEPRDHA